MSLLQLVGQLISLLAKSDGAKRYVSVVLQLIAFVLPIIPGGPLFANLLDVIAGIFGVAGVTHATLTGTIPKAYIASLAAFVGFLATVAVFVPALQPYQAILQEIAAALSAASLGAVAYNKVLPN